MSKFKQKSLSLLIVFSLLIGVVGILNVDSAFASSKKVYLPTGIVAYDYDNGNYVKAKTETIQYNKNKRPKSVKDFNGKTNKITYTMKSGKIRGIECIESDQSFTINKKGYVTGQKMSYLDPYDITRGKDGRISNIAYIDVDGYNGSFDFAVTYKFRKNGTLSKTTIDGQIEESDEMFYITQKASYDKKGFVTLEDYDCSGFGYENRRITKYVYTRDKKGRITNIVVKDKKPNGKYAIVGKYVLKYGKKIKTTNTGTLRSIVNTLVLTTNEEYTSDPIVVNAFNKDKPVSVDLSYVFENRYKYRAEPSEDA